MKATDYLNPNNQAVLGFGAMRMPPEDDTAKMIDVYMASGYNYFDTAYIYGGSEEKLKETLVKRYPRDSFIFADKLPPWEVKKSPEDCERLFKEQLRRTGLDYFDFYLIHSLDDNREQEVEDNGLFEWAAEKKKQGLVKHVGFSFHGGTAYLDRLLARHPEVEFVQLQQNYIDNLRGQASEWHAVAVKHNKPIIVMEPVKGGSLAKLPAAAEALLKKHAPERSLASWAIQYAATLQNVTCVLSGMSSIAQVEDNLKTFKNLKPLTGEEMTILDQVMNEIAKAGGIPCTACKYCHNECPVNIEIAPCFSLYNDVKRGGMKWNADSVYRAIPEAQRAAACIKCGACLAHCPQKIDIPNELDEVKQMFS